MSEWQAVASRVVTISGTGRGNRICKPDWNDLIPRKEIEFLRGLAFDGLVYMATMRQPRRNKNEVIETLMVRDTAEGPDYVGTLVKRQLGVR